MSSFKFTGKQEKGRDCADNSIQSIGIACVTFSPYTGKISIANFLKYIFYADTAVCWIISFLFECQHLRMLALKTACIKHTE